MEIKLKLNGKNILSSVEADTFLLYFLRELGRMESAQTGE